MPSEETSHPSLQASPLGNPRQVSHTKIPTASEVSTQLVRGAKSPMDFIRANSKMAVAPANPPPAQPAPAALPPQSAATQPSATAASVAPEADSSTQAIIDEILKANTQEMEKAAPVDATPEPKVEPNVSTEPVVDAAEIPLSPVRANFKKLETALKAKDTVIKEREEALAVANQKIQDYETGTAVPKAMQDAQNKIAELTSFKHLVDFKASPEYDSQVLKPLTEVQTRLKEIGEAYGIPEEVLERGAGIKNEAELNRFISDHFDPTGAMEVKQLLNQKKSLLGKAAEAEKAPEQALAIMRDNHRKALAVQDQERKTKVAASARSAWQDSLHEIVSKGEVKELILHENNTKFNEDVSKPILTAASVEYGKTISRLAELGVNDLPIDLSRALAKAYLLAHASAYALKSRDLAVKEVNDLQASTRRTTVVHRPVIGSNAPASAPMPSSSPVQSMHDAGRSLIQSVLAKKRA